MKHKKIVAAALAAGCLFLGGCLKAPAPPAAGGAESSGTAQGESAPTDAAPAVLTAVQQVDRIQRALEKNFFLDDLRQVNEVVAAVREDGVEVTVEQTVDTRIRMLHTAPLLSIEVEQKLLGQTTAQSYYYADGMMYWRSGDTRLREEAVWEEVFRMEEGIPADIVLSAEEEETETGTRISMRLDGGKLPDWLIRQNGGNEALEGIDALEVQEAGCVTELSAQGYLLSQKVDMTFLKKGGSAEDFYQRITTAVSFPDIGGEVELVPPEDLDQYIAVNGEGIPEQLIL